MIPNRWRKYSFQTAFISLADFIIELAERVKFWQNILKVNAVVPAVWMPAFFDPAQYLNALRQKKSREELIPARMIKNTFEVMDVVDPTFDNCPNERNVAYIYGMWLEGASWDKKERLLVEQTNSAIYDKFPVVKVVTELMTQQEMDAIDGTLSDFEDNPPLTKKDIEEKEEFDQKQKEQIDREDKQRSALRGEASKAKIQKDDAQGTKQGGMGMSRMNSSMTNSKYNFTRQQSQQSDGDFNKTSASKVSKSSKKGMTKRNSTSQSKMNESSMKQTSKSKMNESQMRSSSMKGATGFGNKKDKTSDGGRDPVSRLASLAKQEFEEDSAEDDESSFHSTDSEEKERRKQANTYYYKCPVFRVSAIQFL